MPSLNDYDIDEHIPQTINSKYFTNAELTLLNIQAHKSLYSTTNVRRLDLE